VCGYAPRTASKPPSGLRISGTSAGQNAAPILRNNTRLFEGRWQFAAILAWIGIVYLGWWLADQRLEFCGPRYNSDYRSCALGVTQTRDRFLIVSLFAGLIFSIALIIIATASPRGANVPSTSEFNRYFGSLPRTRGLLLLAGIGALVIFAFNSSLARELLGVGGRGMQNEVGSNDLANHPDNPFRNLSE
jgi:hypothetical protein